MGKKILCAILLAVACSGCVRVIDLWGARLEFDQGLDVHAGFNSIDTVDDARGVNSRNGAYRGGQNANDKKSR